MVREVQGGEEGGGGGVSSIIQNILEIQEAVGAYGGKVHAIHVNYAAMREIEEQVMGYGYVQTETSPIKDMTINTSLGSVRIMLDAEDALNFPIIIDDSLPPGVGLMGYPGGPKVVMDMRDAPCADQVPIKELTPDTPTT